MPTTDSTIPPLDHDATEALRQQLLRVLAASPCDPLGKPFAMLLAASDACIAAAEGSDYLRLKCASAAIRIAQMLAPERTHIVQVPPDISH